ncbi:MAG: exopolysaccharide biosynthesis polyprenyl glycosylphosphotransferase [Thermoanaerobaculaceae bacterium]
MLRGGRLGGYWGRWLPALDALALLVAGTLAHLIRFRKDDLLIHWQRLEDNPLLVITAFVALWAAATASELYHRWFVTRVELAIRVGFAAGLWALALVLSTYLIPTWKFGRGLLLLTASLWVLGALGVRSVVARWERSKNQLVALLLGEKGQREKLTKALTRHPFSPWTPREVEMENLKEALASENVAVVILVGNEKPSQELVALHFSGVPLVAGSEVWAALEGRLPVDLMPPEVFLHQREFGAIHWEVFNRVTRVVDVILAFFLLILTLPLMALTALLLRFIDGPPVFYHQVRMGQFGRLFRIHKFRTMRRGAEANGPEFAVGNDPRVTKLGRILRRFRVDELPQLWNVLRGEMSLVGPRPERPEFVQALSQQIPYYAFRLAVPPGLTGWAQVNMGYASTLEEHKRKLEYDLYFIRERTLSLYLTVLLRTISAALFGAFR